MSNWIIGLLLAVGAGTWIYSKLMRTTGNNTKSSATGAGIAALFIFFVVWILLGVISGLLSK